MLDVAIVVLVGCSGVNVPQTAKQQDFEKSVVFIRSARQNFNYTTPWKQTEMSQGIGTGFVIAGKRILTNAHNVSNCKYLELRKENVAKRYLGKVAFIGHDCDLAILTVDDESFFDNTVPLELSGIPKVNTTVSTYGFLVGGGRISVTEGVISRIGMDVYAHSGADAHLVIQTDAAINPGNSGGPVIQNDEVVGVAFQGLRQAENIGYLIPTTVIRHFLVDIDDGKYDGFGSLSAELYAGLHNVFYKNYLKVPPQETGMIVVSIMMHSSVESILQVGDVITQIDDYNIDNDGMVQIYGLTLHLGEVIETKQIGEKVELTFYRHGKQMKKTITVALNKPILEYARQYDNPPRYVCLAGLTFIPVTRNFLETWGNNWRTDIPHHLRYLYYNSMQLNNDRKLKEYVVLAEIMPDQINSYSKDFEHESVESINSTMIHCLDDVYDAFKQPIDGFHILKFIGNDRPLIIDAQKTRLRNQIILDKYHIPAEARLEK
jgi:S1-C subfamily serine protease